MPKLHVDRVIVRVRGGSVADARRAALALRPALVRALANTPAAGAPTLADRIAAPLAAKLRGGKP